MAPVYPTIAVSETCKNNNVYKNDWQVNKNTGDLNFFVCNPVKKFTLEVFEADGTTTIKTKDYDLESDGRTEYAVVMPGLDPRRDYKVKLYYTVTPPGFREFSVARQSELTENFSIKLFDPELNKPNVVELYSDLPINVLHGTVKYTSDLGNHYLKIEFSMTQETNFTMLYGKFKWVTTSNNLAMPTLNIVDLGC